MTCHVPFMMCFMRSIILIAALACLCACSSSSNSDKKTTAPAAPAKNTNPLAKYIELVGFRIREKSAGHLEVQFGVVNHSEADIADLKMTVNLTTTAAKPGDPPLVSFEAKLPSLGPQELKQVSVEVPTKIRVYELPDWQFLKPDFQVTEP